MGITELVQGMAEVLKEVRGFINGDIISPGNGDMDQLLPPVAQLRCSGLADAA